MTLHNNQQSGFQVFFETLENQGIKIPPEYRNQIEKKINEVRNYEPKIGVFGKTGVGKSSLCNALFGQDVCPISDIKACTRKPKEVLLSIGGKGLKLVDMPGVGESGERDQEYAELYENLLPQLDLIFWVLKGDDRAFALDEQFYKTLVRPYFNAGKPFFIVINQVDKVEPFREWDSQNRSPSTKQLANIEEKRQSVSVFFELPLAQIIPVSAKERYGLVELVDSIVHALPKHKKIVVLEKIIKAETEAKAEAEKAKAEAEKAKAEAERAKAEAERATSKAEKAKAEAKRAKAERQRSEYTEQRIILDRPTIVSHTAQEEAKRGWKDTLNEIVNGVGEFCSAVLDVAVTVAKFFSWL